MTLKPIAATLLAAGGLYAASSMAAGDMSKEGYASAKERISSEYRVDKERCSSLSGNAKDICQAEAKGKYQSAKADAHASYLGTDKAAADAMVAHAAADYAVAKEKCDDLAGNAKDVCIKEAKAAYTKAEADAKATRKTSAARKEADEEKREADLELAKERCDRFAGDAKTSCVNEAKARFGKS